MMTPSDFWLAAIAVILLLILIRLSAFAKDVRAHFRPKRKRATTGPRPIWKPPANNQLACVYLRAAAPLELMAALWSDCPIWRPELIIAVLSL